MNIKKNGSVSFSIKRTDFDLIDLIEAIPEGAGSDVLRSLLRDGMAYQKLVTDKQVPPNYLTMLLQRLHISLDPQEGESEEIIPVKAAPKQELVSSLEVAPQKAEAKVEPEPEEEITEEDEEADDIEEDFMSQHFTDDIM